VKKKGIFICIEGLDGSGKTTHTHRLVQNLQTKGFNAIYTTEPSRGDLGKFIRGTILEGKKRVPRVVEAVLFAVDRVEHFEKDVKPALAEGKVVVSDRCVYSSLAYQGAAGLDLEWIGEINSSALPPRIETQRKVGEVYMKFVDDGKLVPIDGDRKKGEVEQNILDAVLDFLQNHEAS